MTRHYNGVEYRELPDEWDEEDWALGWSEAEHKWRCPPCRHDVHDFCQIDCGCPCDTPKWDTPALGTIFTHAGTAAIDLEAQA